MEYQIEKYIDVNALVGLMEYYYKLTGIAYGFVDINGNVLGDIGWSNICTSFHRKNKETAARCLESDCYCKNLINKNDKYIVYKCKNGLMEAFVPIYMGDFHVANLFIGQMLFDEPDIDFFIGQAKKFGFNEEEYIKALKEVPIVTKDQLDIYMDFYTSLASMVSSVMYNNHKNLCVEEKLKIHNEKLETEIKEQTNELIIKNTKLREYIDEKERSQRELIAINKKLKVEISKRNYIEEELKSANEKLRLEEERASQLLEALPYAVCVREGEKIVYANDAAAKIFSLDSADKLINMKINDLFAPHPCMELEFFKKLQKISAHINTALEEEILINKTNGKTIYAETSTAEIKYNNEDATLVVFRDITYKKQLEKTNKELNENLNYERLRTEYFSNISHEFRTPLNIIYNAAKMSDIILNSGNEQGQGKIENYLSMIEQNCFRLMKLVNNILDINKFDYDNMQLDLGKFNIVNVIENTVTLISDYAKNKNIDLVFDTEVEEVITMCDADKIERVMFNLLSNAIKFTPQGGEISVMVSYCNDTVEISIKDTGKGIPGDKLNKIFEKFMQVDKSFTRDNEGSGLGLYIVKSIVEMHGGTINVESILEKGSNFIVSLPVKKLDDNINNIQVFNPDSEMLSIEFSDIFME